MHLRSMRFCPQTLAIGLLSFAVLGGASLPAYGAVGNTPAASAPDFGSPPSGQIPILYNDHTVYAKPDILKQSRVLAAFIKNHHIYVPLRSMFEQMGATVTASADGRRFTATKPGTTVSVALGSDVVTVNGEARPLDVPPILYRGVVLVPVRVISEALGAYVLWVHDRRLVVVRYIPITPSSPPPGPTATAAPPAPTPVPTAAPETISYRGFIQAAIASSRTYNEFAAGRTCCRSYVVSAAYAPKNSALAAKVDYRQDAYVTSDNLIDAYNNHYTTFATIDGGFALTPVFLARQTTVDARLEYQVASPRIYLGVGYLRAATNYGYPTLHAVGVGIEKLSNLERGFNLFGSAFYYPSTSGSYTVSDPTSSNAGRTYRQQYRILKYDVGVTLVFAHSPVYLYGGFGGDRYNAKQNAPIDQTHNGPYVGLGVKF